MRFPSVIWELTNKALRSEQKRSKLVSNSQSARPNTCSEAEGIITKESNRKFEVIVWIHKMNAQVIWARL